MKKGTIIAIILAIVLIVAGGIMVTMGLSYAGDGVRESTLTEQVITIAEPFDSIAIDTQDCDVKFVPYNGDMDAEIAILQQETVNHRVLVEDGTLKIQMIDERKWHDYVSIFHVFGRAESMSMTLCIPNTTYKSIQITTDTGDIRIPGVLEAEEMVLRSDTGDVWMEGGSVKTLDCMLSTGDLTVRGGTAMKMKLRTGTGDLAISGLTGEELHLASDTGETNVANVTVQTFSFNGSTGDVELENVQAQEYLQVFTSTGDIEIENSDAPDVNIETSTGDIEVPVAWQFQRIESDTGDIHFE